MKRIMIVVMILMWGEICKGETLQDIATETAIMYKVPVKLFLNLVETESHWKVKAVGSCGEHGLVQMMPGTWKWFSVKIGRPDFRWDSYSFNKYSYIASIKYIQILLEYEITNSDHCNCLN